MAAPLKVQCSDPWTFGSIGKLKLRIKLVDCPVVDKTPDLVDVL